MPKIAPPIPRALLDLAGIPSRAPDLAAAGLTGSPGPLPHLERIQSAFGAHGTIAADIQAFVGGPAAPATSALGARAYAYGDSVAFGAAPDLHTAAHEAAHVVQQRGGVELAGGVGQAGDGHERLADEVADAVVSGRSAEPLLDPVAPPPGAPGSGPPALQLERAERASAAQEDPLLRSAHPEINDRRSSEVLAELRRRALRIRAAITRLRRFAETNQREEIRFAAERGIVGRGFDLFNSQPRPDPARWDMVKESWDTAASLLDSSLGLPTPPGFLGVVAASLQRALETYQEVSELHFRQSRAFLAYTGGHVSAGEDVVLGLAVGSIVTGLVALVLGAVVAAPVIAEAGGVVGVASRIAPGATSAVLSNLATANQVGVVVGGAALSVALANDPGAAARNLLTPEGALQVVAPLLAEGIIRAPGFGRGSGGTPLTRVPINARAPERVGRLTGGQTISPPSPAASGGAPTVATPQQFFENAGRRPPPGPPPPRFDPARHPPLVPPRTAGAGDPISNEVTQPQASVTIATPTRNNNAPIATAPTAIQIDPRATGSGSTTRVPVPDVLSDTPTQRVPVPNPALAQTQPALARTSPPPTGYPALAGERATVRVQANAPGRDNSSPNAAGPSSSPSLSNPTGDVTGDPTGNIVFGRREVLANTELGPSNPPLPAARTPSAVDPNASTGLRNRPRAPDTVDPRGSTGVQLNPPGATSPAEQAGSLRQQLQQLNSRYGSTPAERADRLSRAPPGEVRQFVEEWASVLERRDLFQEQGRLVTPSDPVRFLIDSGVPLRVRSAILQRFGERVSTRQAALRQAQPAGAAISAYSDNVRQLAAGFERRDSVRGLWGASTARYPYWYAVEANFEARGIPPPVRAQVRTILINIEDQPLSHPGLTTGAIPAEVRPLVDASFLIGRMGVVPIQSGEGAIDLRR